MENVYETIKPLENSLFLTQKNMDNLFQISNGPQINLKSPSTPYEDEYKPIEVPDLSIIKTNG